MKPIKICFVCAVLCMAVMGVVSADPAIDITQKCAHFVPLYNALPVNDTFVWSLASREADGLVVGASSGKDQITLFAYAPGESDIRALDVFDAPYWDEPVVALGPDGAIYLGAARVHDKPYVFERLRERPETPGGFYRRRSEPAPGEVNEQAPGMLLREYNPDGRFVRELALPDNLRLDGVGALIVAPASGMLCGLSSPGGNLFTINLETGVAANYGNVIRFAEHHHTRRISRAFMLGSDGRVYFAGADPNGDYPENAGYPFSEYADNDDQLQGYILAFDPVSGSLENTGARLPAIVGRRSMAAIDAAIPLPDGSYLGGTNDGYLFRYVPGASTLETFGKPIRQQGIIGLALGPDNWVYGVGGEPGGMPRLFTFDLESRTFRLGMPPSGNPPGESYASFGDAGGLAMLSDGTLVVAERERRASLLLYKPAAIPESVSVAHQGPALARCTRDRFIETTGAGASLAATFLLSDAPARDINLREALDSGVFARKDFVIESSVASAQLLFYGGGGTEDAPLWITVNGHRIRHIQDRQAMLTGGWDREIIPGGLLHQGLNTVVLNGSGWLAIDTDVNEGRSFKGCSADGPWRSDQLGSTNDLTGEYIIRLRLHGRPAQGTLESPIIDLADADDTGAEASLPQMTRVSALSIEAQADVPANTWIRVEIRSGDALDYTPAQWSDWMPAEAIDQVSLKRYVQWRATLASADARVTPVLRGVTIKADVARSGSNASKITIRQAPDNAVAVSSYPFTYADPQHPRMRHLREKYHLEELVAPGKTELERLDILKQWVRNQWEGWDRGRYDYCPQWDALQVLEMAPAGLALGMCTHYAAVFSQCAASLGYNVRSLIVDHHCLTEVWSDELGKWVLQDVGLVPKQPVAMDYVANGVLLNALEMHERSLRGNADDMDIRPYSPRPIEKMREQLTGLFVRFGIPLRNDHLYNPEPQELAHGEDQYHWDGYLWWTDSLDPKHPEYSMLTNRPEDFYWTLNKTRITLEDTSAQGQIQIRLSGPIPNLKGFQVQLNDGEWSDSPSTFNWTLQDGDNVLRARAVNTMGVICPANEVRVAYVP